MASTNPTAVHRMTAAELARRVRSREVSAAEVVKEAHRVMDALEPRLHAFCTRADELALQAARRVDADLAAGKEVGPLAGVPVGIKDLVATKDIRTVAGSTAYEDWTPDEDDVVVERLSDAGAVILGKTNVPEFGYSGASHNPVFETTRNPWNTDMTSGGSSAGSGAAIATGMCPFAIGSDGGGSIRIPSSFCGLYGIKASMGRVPLYPGCRDERYPGVSSWEYLEHIGPMARTVEDAALMLSVIAGPDDRDRHSIPRADFDWVEVLRDHDLKGLKVAYSANFGYVAVDPEVADIVKSAVGVFEELGCVVEEANPGWDFDPGGAFWALVVLDSDLEGMREMVAKHGHRMSPHLVDLMQKDWKAEDFTEALKVRKLICNRMWRLMRTYDLLVTPTLTVPPFPVGMQGPERVGGRMVLSTAWLSFTYPFNLTGQPAATVPAGWTEKGLPVGMQIVGRHLDDPTVLRASAAYEEARPWADKWPPILAETGM
jgi:aspartyl-tRNA(Asn)/glutamyl-tRNA(Gln) amidotransferase subunit A